MPRRGDAAMMADPWAATRPCGGMSIDHIGIVVRELTPTVDWFERRGFLVSAPTELLDSDGRPMGQKSAYIVFENGYVAINAPIPGTGNPLAPYLAAGEGIHSLSLRSRSAKADHRKLAAGGLAAAKPRRASRAFGRDDGNNRVRFNWFPLAPVIPGVLITVIEHLDPLEVLAPEHIAHPNGARQFQDVLFGGSMPSLALHEDAAAPAILCAQNLPRGIRGFTVSGGGESRLDRREGYFVRALP